MTMDKFTALIELMHHIERFDRARARAVVRAIQADGVTEPKGRQEIREAVMQVDLAQETAVRMRALMALARELRRVPDGDADQLELWLPKLHRSTPIH